MLVAVWRECGKAARPEIKSIERIAWSNMNLRYALEFSRASPRSANARDVIASGRKYANSVERGLYYISLPLGVCTDMSNPTKQHRIPGSFVTYSKGLGKRNSLGLRDHPHGGIDKRECNAYGYNSSSECGGRNCQAGLPGSHG